MHPPIDSSASSDLNSHAAMVLLVDDQVVTGWTLTVAARDLRAAGASAVRPLVLATTG